MYFHLFQEPDGALFTLEQAPVPGSLDAACASLAALDGFWKWYRFTLAVTGPDARRVDCAAHLLDRLDRGSLCGGLAIDADAPALWDLRVAAGRPSRVPGRVGPARCSPVQTVENGSEYT